MTRACFHQKVEEEVELKKGGRVRVLTAESDRDATDETSVWVDYANLPQVLEQGSKIYIDDGLIGLKVLEIGKKRGGELPREGPCSSSPIRCPPPQHYAPDQFWIRSESISNELQTSSSNNSRTFELMQTLSTASTVLGTV